MFSARSLKDAVTERSPAYAILAIDSEDRFKNYEEQRASINSDYNSSPYNFQITKNESIMNGFFTRLAVTEVNFPWIIPNINGRTSEIGFEYQIGAGPAIQTSLLLNYGFYTPHQIAAAIEAEVQALNPALAAFSMSYGNPSAVLNAVDIPVFSYTYCVRLRVCLLPVAYDFSTAYHRCSLFC